MRQVARDPRLGGPERRLVGVQAATTDYDAAAWHAEAGRDPQHKGYPFDGSRKRSADLERAHYSRDEGRSGGSVARGEKPCLRIVAQVPNDPQPLGIGFGKNQPALAAAVSSAIEAMQRNGELGRLKEKWGVA